MKLKIRLRNEILKVDLNRDDIPQDGYWYTHTEHTDVLSYVRGSLQPHGL